MTDEKSRKEREIILARRRFFVASALATVVTTACTPRPCLNVAEPQSPDGGVPEDTNGSAGATGGAGAPPVIEPDAGETTPPTSTGDPQSAPDAGPGPPPLVCLKVAPPPPHVCLEIAEPPSKKK